MNTLFTTRGEPLRYTYFEGTIPELLYLVKAFRDEALVLRDKLDFAYDGIVVSYVDEEIRHRLGRENYINKYSIAVKFDPEVKQTTFRGYTYEVGQDGSITPMIHYDPVEFNGTIHPKSTGSSYARFRELALKEGDYISVKYTNDVMPYVSRLECEHNRLNPNPVVEFIDHCPVCGSKLVLSDSGKTMSCPNMDCPGRARKRMTNMLQKLNIKGFAEASIDKLGVSHLYELESLTEEMLIGRLGDDDGRAFYQVLYSLRNDAWYDYMIMGALGFSSIARKKWQSILQQITLKDLYTLYLSCSDSNMFYTNLISTVNNIGDITGRTICDEFRFFEKDIDFILRNIHIIDSFNSGSEDAIQIRFSGCRNLQLAQQLSTKGIDIDDSGITKKTSILLVPYRGFVSTKTVKAEKYGTKIVPMQDFINNMKSYIGFDLS
jgi:NAD-dependent DNA ligase